LCFIAFGWIFLCQAITDGRSSLVYYCLWLDISLPGNNRRPFSINFVLPMAGQATQKQ